MAVKVKNRNGKTVTLLNPAEKGRKYAVELKNGVKITNDGGKIKRMPDGSAIGLDDKQRAYRAGYLAARQDSADCYNAKRGLPKQKRRNGKKPNKNIVIYYEQ